ncbi:hypothetical protein RMATCC62417_14127 [Rhizopus microsporus]|nr:hypothetical protein RMATCC62417_14127 [Rhizopus microsporus]
MENEFRDVFSTGKVFGTLFDAREAAKDFGVKYNFPLVAHKSNQKFIHLMCKHGKEYENNHKRVSGDEKIVVRQKDTQRIGCPCYIYASKNKFQQFEIRRSHVLHSHRMATDCRTYAVFCHLGAVKLNTVRNLFENMKCNASSILKNLKAQGTNNLVARDLHNIRQQHFKSKNLSLVKFSVNNLKTKDYIVKVRANSNNVVDMVFFAEARRMPECIVIDATYKTNSHGLAFLNIVGTSNTTGDVRDTLTTYHIAGVWMEHEKTENYLWALQMLKDSVFPDALVANTSLELPYVFVTDNESALRWAIATVFLSPNTLLCYLHLLRNVQKYALQNLTKNYSNGIQFMIEISE